MPIIRIAIEIRPNLDTLWVESLPFLNEYIISKYIKTGKITERTTEFYDANNNIVSVNLAIKKVRTTFFLNEESLNEFEEDATRMFFNEKYREDTNNQLGITRSIEVVRS